MKHMIIVSIAVLSLLFLAGCAKEIVNEEADEPRICTADWSPVCGVDGQTYSNNCNAGDVEVAYEGECIETSHACTAEEKENQICTREYRPVCGNDGQTYSTGCIACSAGIDSWTEGEC